jgi:hypothetical protein
MSSDDEAGMAWWNALTEQERAKWSAIAGDTGRAKDAWEAFKRGRSGDTAELRPADVLADLLGSGDFPAEVLDPVGAAAVVIERLLDAGFEVVPITREGRT